MDGTESGDQVAVAPSLGGQSADDALIAPARARIESDADLAAFVGVNVEKFVPSYRPGGGRRWFRPCWPGFFFPVAWFLYRKMYGWAAFACALPIFASTMNFGSFTTVLTAAPSLVGLAGRPLYVVGARSVIARLRGGAGDRPDEDLRRLLAEAGGVSTAGAIVGGLIVVLGFAVTFGYGFAAALKAHHP